MSYSEKNFFKNSIAYFRQFYIHKICSKSIETEDEFTKTEINSCYITYDMDFWFIPSDPVCFDKLSHCD